MKRINLYFACLAMLLLATACGSDEPDLDRQRDTSVSCSLTHVLDPSTGQATLSTTDVSTVLVHQRALTADFDLQVTIGGTKRRFTVTGVPLKRVENQDYRYTFADGQGGGVTNLKGTVDVSDVVLIMSYDADGYHVDATIPEVFFAQTGVKFNYTDGTTTTAAGSFWTLKVDNEARSGSVEINDLTIARDSVIEFVTDKNGIRQEVPSRKGRHLTRLFGRQATIAPTAKGFKVTGEQLNSVATISSDLTKQTVDYIVRNVDIEVDMKTGRMDGTLVIRHVFKRDPDNVPTEWDDINAQVSGETFRVSPIQ